MDIPPPARTHVVGVVDDDPACTVVLSRILSQAGYAVKVYGSGESVLEAVGRDGLELVCLDLSLPGMDGLETLARLKRLHGRLAVVLFTADAAAVAAEAKAAGAFACVAKDGAWTELRAAVTAALEVRT